MTKIKYLSYVQDCVEETFIILSCVSTRNSCAIMIACMEYVKCDDSECDVTIQGILNPVVVDDSLFYTTTSALVNKVLTVVESQKDKSP